MKRYRLRFTRPYYITVMYVELSANSMHEAIVKGREFIKKAYGENDMGYVLYVISAVERIHTK